MSAPNRASNIRLSPPDLAAAHLISDVGWTILKVNGGLMAE
jgi:hypothetical protein